VIGVVMNNFKLGILMFGLIILFVLIGQAVGGRGGALVALIFSFGMNFVSYWFSDRIVLAMYRAKPLDRENSRELYDMVEEIAHKASIPPPRLYLVESASPNAFATGRNPQNAAVAVTSGLLNILDSREIAAVISHEIGHVVNRDTLITTVVAGFAGAIFFIADMGRWALMFGGFSRDNESRGGLGTLLLLIVAPIAALLLQMMISRSREYKADRASAIIMHDGAPLANALIKLNANARIAPPFHSAAAAAMMIQNPFSGQGLMELMSTHPSLENRLAALKEFQTELQNY
jgi:heat shock protein HtpX